MKYFFLSLILLTCSNLFGQVKVTQGNNSPQFTLTSQPDFTSFNTEKTNFFVIHRIEDFENINLLIAADKAGSIITDKEIKVNRGTFNSQTSIKKLLVVGATPVVFIENHDKASGKNSLTAATVDANGIVSETRVAIATMDFVKMTNAGEWCAALTPDMHHVAIIGKPAYEKGGVNQFVYYILDDKLNVTSKGNFSFAGITKNISIYNFLASDKGDFYILSEDFDKSYKYPTLYKYTVGGSAVTIPVMIADPDLKNLDYTVKLNAAGDLLIAGYMQKKKSFTVNDVEAVGTWLFNSSKINEVKTFNFDKPITNATARNIIFNGDVFYLVGEQYKADKEQTSGSALATFNAPVIYNYTHGDIIVTGFTNDGSKKFETTVSRLWKAREFDQDLMVASGIINNKLALVFNDQYGKYFDDKYHKNYKLPVEVSITNDGLMESPVLFAKELDVIVSSYTLYPQFFNDDSGQLMLLSGNNQSIKTVTFH